jgi:hypothetical protein
MAKEAKKNPSQVSKPRQNSHLLHLKPEPQVWFGFAPGSAGS